METMKETIKALLQELILPELKDIKDTLLRHEERLNAINKRIDDINLHLADQSRRIDELRQELTGRINEINRRIDRLYEVVVRRDEHFKLDERVSRLEREVDELKSRLAA